METVVKVLAGFVLVPLFLLFMVVMVGQILSALGEIFSFGTRHRRRSDDDDE